MNLVRVAEQVWVNPEAVVGIHDTGSAANVTALELDTGVTMTVDGLTPDQVAEELARLSRLGDAEVVTMDGTVRSFR